MARLNYFWFILVICPVLARVKSQVPSEGEFQQGVTSNGFPHPSSSVYKGYRDSLKQAKISKKLEAAMYLAQMLHESDGLKTKREYGCSGLGGCVDKYPASSEWLPECKNRPGGVGYYGRGYIQLTWCSNYVPASRALLGDGNRLKQNPDLVAQQEGLAWGVSGWFWGDRVHGALGNSDQFGLTTKAINGQTQECQGNGQNADKSRQRFRYYENVFRAFKLPGRPNPAGCPY